MTKKYCPILFQDGFQKECVTTECAWYEEKTEKCAVLLMGIDARQKIKPDQE